MKTSPFRYPETGPHAIRPCAVRKGYADEHFLSDYRFQFPREDPNLAEVFVYTPRMSYFPGETVEFHGSSTAETWNMQIYRDGARPEMVHEAFDMPGVFAPTSETAYVDGCDWPVVHSWAIPEGLRPGFYLVVSTCLRKSGERFVQHHFIVVRATPETSRGKILLMLAHRHLDGLQRLGRGQPLLRHLRAGEKRGLAASVDAPPLDAGQAVAAQGRGARRADPAARDERPCPATRRRNGAIPTASGSITPPPAGPSSTAISPIGPNAKATAST